MKRVLVGGAAVVVAAVLVAGAALLPTDEPTSPAVAEPVAKVPVAYVPGLDARGSVSWERPLRVVATGGEISAVTGAGPDGRPVQGRLIDPSTWQLTSTLYPGSTYALTAVVGGRSLPVRVTTTKAAKPFSAVLSPGDGAVVGVGMPVVLTLDRDVEDRAARRAVVEQLTVASTPSQPGAWRWLDDRTLHYRPAAYWKAGTRVRVTAALGRVRLPGGVWGPGTRTTSYRVGQSLVSTVDVSRHTMTIRRDGRVVRVMKASMGRPGFPTRGGRHIVLEKHAVKTMDAATLGYAPGSADYYRTTVKWAVRITYSGTFTHAAPWSVRDQGRRNVSHGCINLSPADAKWFFDRTRRGDPVEVVGTRVKPLSYDPGSADWNMSFAEWKRG